MNGYEIFPTGTRVRVIDKEMINPDTDNYRARTVAGMIGTVMGNYRPDYFLDRYATVVSVEFDDPVPVPGHGHDCGGVCKMHHGWNVKVEHLVSLQIETPEYAAWCEYDQLEE